MADRKVIQVRISDLKPYKHNARTHDDRQIRKIANSIDTFGFNNPILIDLDQGIIAGHGRYEAAKLLKMTQVPCIQLAHLTKAEQKAYILADNRLAELASWDNKVLSLEFSELVNCDLDFDISITGFEMPEIDSIILSDDEVDASEPVEPEPGLPDGPAVSRPGDLWILGEHRLYCGNSAERVSYEQLLGRSLVDLVFTDPPYNVPITGNVTRNARHKDFAMACGEMSSDEFTAWLTAILRLAALHSRSGSLHYVCMDWRHLLELLTAGCAVYAEQINLCVWNKDNGGMGSMYRSKHECIGVFRVDTTPHINNVQLGRFGRYRTNVWDYAGMSSLQKDRDALLAMHPTVKPVALIADAILDASHRGDLVLDPFGGSGSTLLAAQRTGRAARLIEIDPNYVDVTIRRFQNVTGQQAIHSEEQTTFDMLAETRNATPMAVEETCDEQ